MILPNNGWCCADSVQCQPLFSSILLQTLLAITHHIGGLAMFKLNILLSIAFIVALLSVSGCVDINNNAEINQLLSSLNTGSAGLSESTIAAGLRQALEVGGERASSAASKKGGFLSDSRIRIPLPEKLQTMANGLRAIGFGSQVDNFEVEMNLAAEAAAFEAKPVLLQAVKGMTLTDIMGIYNGSDTAATDYFKQKTSAELNQRFQPVVHDKMRQVGVYQTYSQLEQQYNALPLTSKPNFNLEDYLTRKTADGLFVLLADEEKQIRNNPAARTTELLKQVFGSK